MPDEINSSLLTIFKNNYECVKIKSILLISTKTVHYLAWIYNTIQFLIIFLTEYCVSL